MGWNRAASVEYAGAVGSGSVIAPGLILTAYHVVEALPGLQGRPRVVRVLNDGAEGPEVHAEVAWHRGDAALLRLKGTGAAIALAIDGPGPARLGALDPYLAGASAVLEGALNVACSGATPIGITDCLNFGSPETDLGAWQLERAIDGIADACRLLDLPVVSGNVSLYNETPDGPTTYFVIERD